MKIPVFHDDQHAPPLFLDRIIERSGRCRQGHRQIRLVINGAVLPL